MTVETISVIVSATATAVAVLSLFLARTATPPKTAREVPSVSEISGRITQFQRSMSRTFIIHVVLAITIFAGVVLFGYYTVDFARASGPTWLVRFVRDGRLSVLSWIAGIVVLLATMLDYQSRRRYLRDLRAEIEALRRDSDLDKHKRPDSLSNDNKV